MREESTEEPWGFGIVGEASSRVIWVSGCRRDKERAVDTEVDGQLDGVESWLCRHWE